jgi:phosphatidylglycerophosphate synthase
MLDDLLPIVVPLAFFWAVAFVARTIGETRTRRRLIETKATPEFAAAVMRDAPRDIAAHDSLKWGLLIGAVGLALIVVQFLPYRTDEPIAIGVVLVFGAAGLLAHYAATRRLASVQR